MEGTNMFARIVEFVPKYDKKDELIKTMKNEVVPILKKQPGFLEVLPLFPETTNEKAVTITLWMEKRDAERFEKETFPKVENIMKPYLTTPITWKLHQVETTLCEHFVQALAA
jgi:heme-degrading monooxygenase HmoA